MSATTTPNCSNPKLARGTPGTAGSSFGGKSYDITFTGLCFDVEDRATGKEKRILTNVSGMASAGRMLAIMGASGAGKTTLLDVLACNSSFSGTKLTGEVRINGKPRNRTTFQRLSCYVQQKDVLMASATVREALMTSAQLRLPVSVPKEQKRALVQSVLQELDLVACADTLVGDELLGLKGISGGQKRRLSVGIELVKDPRIIFLDEPTSGLDSEMAYGVVELLVSLARRAPQRTVVCTIHQPSSDITDLFDDFLLLARGRVVYGGVWRGAVGFFETAGFACPMYKNPTDYFMAVIKDADSAETLSTAYEKRAAALLAEQRHAAVASRVSFRRTDTALSAGTTTATPRHGFGASGYAGESQYSDQQQPQDTAAPVQRRSGPGTGPGSAAGGDVEEGQPETPKLITGTGAHHPGHLALDIESIQRKAAAGTGTGTGTAAHNTPLSTPDRALVATPGGTIDAAASGLVTAADADAAGTGTGMAQASGMVLLDGTEQMVNTEQGGEEVMHEAVPWWYQSQVLIKRNWVNWIRNPVMLSSELIQYIFLSLFIGLMYLRFSNTVERGVYDRAACIWFAFTILCFTPSYTAVTAWDRERFILKRELKQRQYNVLSYYLARNAVLIPFEAVQCLIFTAIMYFMAGFQADFAKFMLFFGVLVMFQIVSEGLGLICGVITRQATYAVILLTFILLLLLSFSGFLTSKVPVYFDWLGKASYLTHAYGACIKSEFEGLRLKDADGQWVDAMQYLPKQTEIGLTLGQSIGVLAAEMAGMEVIKLAALWLGNRYNLY